MKKFLSAACLLALCGGVVNAAQCPTWKAVSEDDTGGSLSLIGHDDIIIKDIIVNRGNCIIVPGETNELMPLLIDTAKKKKGNKWQQWLVMLDSGLGEGVKGLEELFKGVKTIKEFKLKFGEKKDFITFCTSDSILEVKLITNLGDCVLPKAN